MGVGDTPGPGQYYPKDKWPSHFAFSKETRSKDMKGGDPGPARRYVLMKSMRFLQLCLLLPTT